MAVRRLGCLGGSFDPFHLGHRRLAEVAIAEAGLDEVWILPARRSPHKLERPPAPAEVRWMTAVLGTLDDPRLRVARLELDRSGPSYTVDTVRELQGILGSQTELFWLIGADHLPLLKTWRRAEELLDACRFLVVPRDGLEGDALDKAIARELGSHAPRVQALHMEPLAVSSTVLRERLAAGEDVEDMVPRLTALYLRRYNPYLRPNASGQVP